MTDTPPVRTMRKSCEKKLSPPLQCEWAPAEGGRLERRYPSTGMLSAATIRAWASLAVR